jgi:hypothetical protein
VAGVTVAYGLGLCLTVIPFSRYCLPVVVLLNFLAALAAGCALGRLPGKARWGLGIAMAAALLADQGVLSARYAYQFGHDSRMLARRWLAEHAPAQGLICQDATAGLAGELPGQPTPPQERLKTSQYAADLGSVDELTSSGVRMIVLCDLSYARYLRAGVKPAPGKEAEFERRRRWYRQLLEMGKPAWVSASPWRVPGPTNPEIRIYLLPARP